MIGAGHVSRDSREMSAVVGTLGHYVGRIFLTTVAALLIYFALKVIRKIFKAYQEVFVMWTVMFGRRWMPKERSLRIQPYLCRTADLDDVSIDECFQFHSEAFLPADEGVTKEQSHYFAIYRKTLLSYSHILLCREKLDGSLRGLVLMGLQYKKTHTVLKVGLTLTHKNYRGGPWMKVVAACLIMRELILHPFVPVYLITKMSTYKSYLISTSYPDSHPRYDKEAPEEYKKIAEDFVRSIQSPEDEYDRDTFVLRRRTAIVNEHLAAISERELQNPHISFFNERNPGWREGDQLVAMAKMTLKNLLIYCLQVTLPKFFKQSPSSRVNVAGNVSRRKAEKLRARLTRGLTYQDMVAGIHSLRFHAQEISKRNKELKRRDSYIKRLYSHSDDEDFNIDL
jgi:hypothetical protein